MTSLKQGQNDMAKTHWQLNPLDLQLIDLALQEDLGFPYADVTTQLLFEQSHPAHARIVSKHTHPVTVCGIPLADALAAKFGNAYEVVSDHQDGDRLLKGEVLIKLAGPAHVLLMIERLLLNFLQHLSGVATLTALYVEKLKRYQTKILDTRKTMPGLRHLDKYAVYCGGGCNHRIGLYDAVMIKDTHIDMLGGIETALGKLPDETIASLPVIVEVRSEHELSVILEKAPHKVSRVLLDNMSPETMKRCVSMCDGKLPTEASGNIDLTNIVAVADCGVDFVSIGKLTHSVPNVDLSMQCG